MTTRIAVTACMKNEGPFVMEWVAHYLALGFHQAFVLTNDCDDGTDLILDRLAQLAPVTHIRNEVPEGGFAQETGMAALKASGLLDDIDWLLHADADELLYLHDPDPDIGRFLDSLPPSDAVAFDWRFAGTDLTQWPGGLVVENCPMGAAALTETEPFSKTIFRPALFAFFSDHMPKMPARPDVVVRNSLGQELPNAAMFHPRKSRYIRGGIDHLSWDRAEMRHYALRAQDVFAIKALRGFGIHPRPEKYRVGSRFWKLANRRDVTLAADPAWLGRLRGWMAEFLADPQLSRLQEAAIASVREKHERLKAITA